MNALAAIGHVALIKIAKLHLQLRSSLMKCLRLCNVDGPNVTWADCGWRSVAAALEYSKNKTDITAEQARIQGATLRAQTISHLRKHKHEYIQFVAKDKDSAPEEPTPDLEEA